MACEQEPQRSQAEISQSYLEAPHGQPVTVRVGQQSLDYLTALGILDQTNIAAQMRRACGEYTERRLDDPTLDEQVEAERMRQTTTLAKLSELAGVQLATDHEAAAPSPAPTEIPKTKEHTITEDRHDETVPAAASIEGYLERASTSRYSMEEDEQYEARRNVVTAMGTAELNRLITLTHVYSGSTIGDHVRAAVMFYSDQLAQGSDFVTRVEEQRRRLEGMLPTR